MLRARSSGVAQFSQHVNGNAIDFYIPGVPLATVRAEGLRLQRGGVGFYPTSGSPFVHMDTGSIRHWPRIAREELAKIFPDGRTVHIPSDGQPLPGYALALADVERRGAAPSETSLEAAREAGVITASQEQRGRKAQAQPARQDFRQRQGCRMSRASSRRPNQPTRARAAHGGRQPEPAKSPPKPVAVEHIVPLPAARPKPVAVAAVAAEAEAGRAEYRDGVAAEQRVRRPRLLAQRGRERARRCRRRSRPARGMRPPRVDPASTGSTADDALAYAAESDTPARRARPPDGLAPAPHAGGSQGDAGVVQHHRGGEAAAGAAPWPLGGGERSDSPWLRAAILTPSVSDFMTANRIGAIDPRWLYDLLHKPSQSLVMTFSADPHLGMVADRFTGSAVVFLATATFNTQTASLR